MARVQVYLFVAASLFIAGFPCDDNFSPEMQYFQPEIRETISAKLKESYGLNGYGIISREKWNKTNDVVMVNIQSARCSDLDECLSRGLVRRSSESSCNFIILPSGQIVKSSDQKNGAEVKICLAAKDERKPTTVIMEAYAFLVQALVNLRKVRKPFQCFYTDITLYSVGTALKIMEWCQWYRNIFDKDLLVYRTPVVGDVEVVSRSDWDPIEPTRDLDTITMKAEVVEVHLAYPPCSSRERCTAAAQYMRRVHAREYGDLYSNFIIGGDGRVYECLGWNSTRAKKSVQFHFLVETQESVPRMLALSAFIFQIRDGIRLRKISKEYTVETASIHNRTVAEEIEEWVAWSRKTLGEKSIAIAPSAVANETQVGTKVLHPLRHPIRNVLFTTCSMGSDGIPFVRRSRGKTVMSAKQVRSNFYLAGDEAAYEGLGWNQTASEDEVVFEFLISDLDALPSNQSMLVSTFLIREGVKRGYLRADYDLMVADHTSTDFENMVRFWDGRVRD